MRLINLGWLLALLLTLPCGVVDADDEPPAKPHRPPDVGLHQAALQGDLVAVRGHIAAGSDLNQVDAFGSTPLTVAVTFGRTKVVKALLGAGADTAKTDGRGSPPLLLAALFGHPEIVEVLLAAGANRHARNRSGATALDFVSTPFGPDKPLYDRIGLALAPLGLQLDYERIAATRSRIAEMLRPTAKDLEGVVYEPLPADDWKVSTPAAQGLDRELMAELYLDAARLETLRALLVVKNGHLIAERYFTDGSVDQKARLQSVTKSFTSALAGIAKARGHLTSLDQKVVEFFPEIADRVTDKRKRGISIRHLLQMRGGFPWEEIEPELWKALLSGRYPHLLESIALVNDPGTAFHYSNLSSNWLGILIARSTGTQLAPFAKKHLFAPLGIEAGEWGTDAEGHNNGCADLHLRARDMAKFGLLYLEGGRWAGRQVIPEAWVRASLTSYSDKAWVATPPQNWIGRYFKKLGYGYQWWSAGVAERRVDYAAGHGGQLIVLLRDLKMVIAVTAHPFYLERNARSWKHEQAIFNLVGKFIRSLPSE